jgi:large subunit ribosomal protein L23
MNTFQVLRSPAVTEKSTILQEQGKYVFKVDVMASKTAIAHAVEQAFNVHVKSVNTLKTHGKVKSYGRRRTKQPDTKKAIVTLAAGETIQLFEGA